MQVEYEFTLRDEAGATEVVKETHRLGAFRRTTWLQLLAEAGFGPEARVSGEPADGGHRPRHLFIGRRPDRPTAEPAPAAALTTRYAGGASAGRISVIHGGMTVVSPRYWRRRMHYGSGGTA